ncbi:pentatricopeptide repeat-containing protein 1, mitochondrial [Ostrinia nubilalis]|uniref:pentatricopeptide repeat-containing protein 1, mitochondrial n=1 Tax=Ostrinia nubilalis TaxID=29057 RepID=UPI0030825E33
MAHRCLRLLQVIRNRTSIPCIFKSTSISTNIEPKSIKINQIKTEDNFTYLDDPDQFGTLTKSVKVIEDEFSDPGDVQEQEYIQNNPLPNQKLTTKQYADLIKQYLSHKRLKEAINVLEVRMLTVDRVKPENYIYNILIGACAEVGYTKKAFKLFNDMKKRALKPTGDTYTCLFHACSNSPWAKDGLLHAKNLRSLMIEKGIEPNLTNYNAMIKAFGRCGDIATAFQIVDEMISKKIKIRVHTLNHLLHACISDKESGLRHALVVWRKMLRMREKPNLFSFNLMLRCVKDCNLGSKNDIEELVCLLREHIAIGSRHVEVMQIDASEAKPHISDDNKILQSLPGKNIENSNEIIVSDKNNDRDSVNITITNNLSKHTQVEDRRTVPNLLSKIVQMQQVLSLQEVHSVQDKFAIVGGLDDFLKEMQIYSVKPDIKTFTQMLPLIDNTPEAENHLLETMKTQGIRADIDFYNNLIKKRCLRTDYDGAFAVKDLVEEECKIRNKKIHPLKKKFRLKFNIMTYGVLALACRTKESADKLLTEMNENKLKVNIEILGTLLKNGAMNMDFEYVLYMMEKVKEENIKVNEAFLKHLETLSDRCTKRIAQAQTTPTPSANAVMRGSKNFMKVYKTWLKDVNVYEHLKPEHPWQQFEETYPETVQRSNVEIKEPKRFYKRNRKFVQYKL